MPNHPDPDLSAPHSSLNAAVGDKVFAFGVAKRICVPRGWLRGFSCWQKERSYGCAATPVGGQHTSSPLTLILEEFWLKESKKLLLD